MVRTICVQPLLDSPCCHRQRPTPSGHLDRLEIQAIGRPRGDQRFDFADDLARERRFEPPFLAAPSSEAASAAPSSASAHRSHASQ